MYASGVAAAYLEMTATRLELAAVLQKFISSLPQSVWNSQKRFRSD